MAAKQLNTKSLPTYTVGSYQLSILYIVVCVCQSQSPSLSPPNLPPGNHKFVFHICDSISDKTSNYSWELTYSGAQCIIIISLNVSSL